VDGSIKVSREIAEKYPYVAYGCIVGKLHYSHQVWTHGWYGVELTAEQRQIIEDEVVDRMLKSGFAMHD